MSYGTVVLNRIKCHVIIFKIIPIINCRIKKVEFYVHKVWCLINVKTFLRVYSDIVTLLAEKKGEPREKNPLRLITVELLEFTRHIGLEGCGDVAHKMICEIRAIVKGGSGIKLDVETLKSFVSKAGYGINWIRQMRNHQLAQVRSDMLSKTLKSVYLLHK